MADETEGAKTSGEQQEGLRPEGAPPPEGAPRPEGAPTAAPGKATPPPPKHHEPPGNPTMAAPPAERARAAELAQKQAGAAAAAPAAGEVSRRGFFSWAAVAWVGFAAAIGGCVTAFGRFMVPNVLFEPPTRFKVGRPEDFPPGVVDERFKESRGVWIVNLDGQIVSLIAICTHLGCPPNWLEAQNKFKCPCHGSGYYKDGINFEGPTPRPLERAAIWIDADDGQIVVDKAQRFQWELGQWEDPQSFVTLA